MGNSSVTCRREERDWGLSGHQIVSYDPSFVTWYMNRGGRAQLFDDSPASLEERSRSARTYRNYEREDDLGPGRDYEERRRRWAEGPPLLDEVITAKRQIGNKRSIQALSLENEDAGPGNARYSDDPAHIRRPMQNKKARVHLGGEAMHIDVTTVEAEDEPVGDVDIVG